MLNKLLLCAALLLAAMSIAIAQVDANNADQAALDGIKGLGPSTSKSIIAERTRGGKFKDWSDFAARVKGIGEKKSSQLSQAGLRVNGQRKPGVPDAPISSIRTTSPLALQPRTP